MDNDHTYGIASDPLTQFACLFAALVHDVDHHGVPNATLVEEGSPLAKKFKSQSVLEQNSVIIALDMLMEPGYENLRSAIYKDVVEMHRFRQLVVNAVMATDLANKELKQLRNDRWEKAFSSKEPESESVARNRKATIIIEHLIQASDVAHTMQHWHVYRHWNEKLFEEMYQAYKNNRSKENPASFWYQGELAFFDFYILPLARKLKECGVFGVSSDEYIACAIANRNEWEVKGVQIVDEMVKKFSHNMSPKSGDINA